jgi:hypothetical protein
MCARSVRGFAIFIFLLAMAGFADALTVAVAPAQDTDYAPSSEARGSPIAYVVTGCMDALFDSGHVATDTPPVQVSRSAWGRNAYALTGASEGLVDYVIALYVEWAPSAFHKEVLLPTSIVYRLVQVSDGTVQGEGTVAGVPDSEDASAHEARTAIQVGRLAAVPCVELLAALAKGGKQ